MTLGPGRYAVVIDGVVHRYGHWDDLPARYDNLIEFVPEIPPEPHTEAQHAAIERLPEIMRQFLAREKRHASRNSDW